MAGKIQFLYRMKMTPNSANKTCLLHNKVKFHNVSVFVLLLWPPEKLVICLGSIRQFWGKTMTNNWLVRPWGWRPLLGNLRSVTRLHSSRMHTTRLLAVSPSMHCSGGSAPRGCSGGGLVWRGVCIPTCIEADPPLWTESQTAVKT